VPKGKCIKVLMRQFALAEVFQYFIAAVRYASSIPMSPLDTCVERLWLLSDAPAHSKERIAPSGTIDLVINLHENELRIFDPAKPERCKRFSGAVISGAHSGPFVIDPRELVSVDALGNFGHRTSRAVVRSQNAGRAV
jgi:hypothetical protein